MIKASQIIGYRYVSDDSAITEEIKNEIAQSRSERTPFYLTKVEFDKILHWKLRGQYGRSSRWHAANSDELIQEITEVAFSINHPDPEYLLELRIGILTCLRGVGVPVASSILALVYPEEYAVIDFRVWRQVFGKDKTVFSINDYKRYLEEIRKLSEQLHWPIQEVDLAIWEFDRRNPYSILTKD